MNCRKPALAAAAAFAVACADPAQLIEAPFELAEARASSGISIIDLGSISADGSSEARAINTSGVIVGYAFTKKSEPEMFMHALRWTVSSSGAVAWDNLMAVLGAPASADAMALAVNDAGAIGGIMRTSDQSQYHGFVLSAANVVSDVSTFPRCDGAPDNTNSSTVRDINNHGEIVGQKVFYPRSTGAPLYSYYADLRVPAPCVVELPPGAPYAINDSSVIVGEDFGSAVTWRRTGGTWSVSALGRSRTRAWAISAAGDVAGQFASPATTGIDQRAMIWKNSPGGYTERELGALDNATQSVANGIEGGRVVGWAHNRQLYMRAFDWTEDGGMRDLGTLGEKRAGAWAVSGKNVVGYSELPTPGRQITSHATLWRLP